MQRFEGTIAAANGGGAYIPIPTEIIAALGGGGRIPVRATFDGIAYSATSSASVSRARRVSSSTPIAPGR
ncbi:DUF1905 domain-containing protein [Nocardia inohanensis]|uniref:DUF1905 domain-containing protein n=1 Tax=Nocardia inohanensis TaxID=209246 RepID=UPI0008322AF1|nr:DUF1905 domain-containing protein [Nocardia inohanensis]